MPDLVELEKLIAEYQNLSVLEKKTQQDINKINKIAEKIGEINTEIEIRKEYGQLIKEKINVPVRKNNVPVFDLGFILNNEEVLIPESKFGTSQVGRVNETIFAADETGTGTEKLTLKKQVDQGSGQWVKDRIKELRRMAGEIRAEIKEIRKIDEIDKLIKKDTIIAKKEIDSIISKNNLLSKKEIGSLSLEKKMEVLAERKAALSAKRLKATHKVNELEKLTNRLEQAAQNGKLKFIFYRTWLEVAPGGKIITRVHKIDGTKEVTDFFRSGRSQITDSNRHNERKFAKEEGFLKNDKSKALEKASKLESEYKIAKKEVEALEKASIEYFEYNKAKEEVKNLESKIKRHLGDSKKVIKPETKFKHEEQARLLKENDLPKAKKDLEIKEKVWKDEIANPKNEELAKAKRNFLDKEKAWKEAVKETDDLLLKLESAEKESKNIRYERYKQSKEALEKLTSKPDSTKPPASGTSKPENIINDRGNLSKGVENKGINVKDTAKLAEKGTQVIKSEVKVSKVWRVFALTKNIGKVAVLLILPTTFLEIFIEFAIRYISWLIDRWNKEEREEKEEWARILKFLLSNTKVNQSPLKLYYIEGYGQTIMNFTNEKIYDSNYDKNFLYWLRKWDAENNWVGFVYPRVNINLLNRQQRTNIPQNDSLRLPSIRYYLDSPIIIDFTEKTLGQNNSKIELNKSSGTYGPQDDKNRFTGGKDNIKPSANLNESWTTEQAHESNAFVISTNLSIRYTIPSPVLTPFDFVIFKCRNLIVEIMRFISKYDERAELIPYVEDIPFAQVYLHENTQFSKPINFENAHYCLKQLLTIIHNLSLHPHDRGDFKTEPGLFFSAGHERRHNIIFKILTPNPKNSYIYQVAIRLNSLVNDLNPKLQRQPLNNELDYLTTESLYDMAMDIQNDILRIWKEIRSENKYRRLLYEYRGTIDI